MSSTNNSTRQVNDTNNSTKGKMPLSIRTSNPAGASRNFVIDPIEHTGSIEASLPSNMLTTPAPVEEPSLRHGKLTWTRTNEFRNTRPPTPEPRHRGKLTVCGGIKPTAGDTQTPPVSILNRAHPLRQTEATCTTSGPASKEIAPPIEATAPPSNPTLDDTKEFWSKARENATPPPTEAAPKANPTLDDTKDVWATARKNAEERAQCDRKAKETIGHKFAGSRLNDIIDERVVWWAQANSNAERALFEAQQESQEEGRAW